MPRSLRRARAMWPSMAVIACGEMAAEATIGMRSEYGCSRSSRVNSARASCSSIRVATGAISDWTVIAFSDSEQNDPPAPPDPHSVSPGTAGDGVGADDCVADRGAASPDQARSESSPGHCRRLFSHCLRIRGRRGAESVLSGRRGEPHKAPRNFELAVFGAQSFKLQTEHPPSRRSQLPADHAADRPAEEPAERLARNRERGFGQRLQN